MGAISNTPEDSASALKPPTIPAAKLCSFIALWTLCALFASATLCFQHIADSFAKNMGGGGTARVVGTGSMPDKSFKNVSSSRWAMLAGLLRRYRRRIGGR